MKELRRKVPPVLSHSALPLRPRCSALLLAGLLGLIALAGCIHRDPEPYVPDRPFVGPSGKRPAEPASAGSYPERELIASGAARLRSGELSPPAAVAEVSQIIRAVYQQAALPRMEGRILLLAAAIDSVKSEIERLGITGGAVMRQRLDRARPEDLERFRAAAQLYERWGLLGMRDGRVEERTAGGARIEQAIDWAPEDPIPTLLLSAYEDVAGFRSNALERLDRFVQAHGPSDVIDLARMRKNEREWKIEGDTTALATARSIAKEVAGRHGGWTEAEPWLLMERSRLAFFSDSLDAAGALASAALATARARADTYTEVEAHLMLGITMTRFLDYPEATGHLDAALEVAARDANAGELASWLTVPWDQWTPAEREQYDRNPDRVGTIERFWQITDPIWATPRLLENRTEYRCRVAEAWFTFSDVDPITPGPLTEPGRAILRFGWPTAWKHQGSRPLLGSARQPLDFSVYQTWRFEYEVGLTGADPFELTDDMRRARRQIVFQEIPGTSRFHCADSLTAPDWPPSFFNFDFLGHGYHYHTTTTRFRDPTGGTKLYVAIDTQLPDYALRYPMQGIRFSGSASIDLTLYREERRGEKASRRDSTAAVRLEGKRQWISGARQSLVLRDEDRMRQSWEFRRRAGMAHVGRLPAGRLRVASMLSLVDDRGRVVALGADNGDTLTLRDFSEGALDASDLMLLTTLGDSLGDETERTPAPGIVVYGYDLADLRPLPKGGRLFLRGERIAYYLELYNLELASRDRPAVEFSTAIERLSEDGEPEYRVTFRGEGWRLDKEQVTQWNIARSLGVTDLDPGLYRLIVTVDAGKREMALYRAAYFRVVEPDDLAALYRWSELPLPRR